MVEASETGSVAGRSCAIMQPTYLPWSGYFALMAQVDVFVLLDDVQFSKGSWQSRNRILVGGESRFITVPVRKAPLSTLISRVEVNADRDWRGEHVALLQEAYAARPHGEVAIELVRRVLARGHRHLSALNCDMIREIAEALGIATPLVLASELACSGRRSEHVANICRAVGCEAYVSPPGARDYLEEDRFADSYGLSLTYQDYRPAAYDQGVAADFVSHLSIIDVVAHQGLDYARSYISPEAPK